VIPIGFVGAISWSVWLVRFTLSRLYRPAPNGFRATTSVVIPSYREDPDIIDECLESWLRENPTEVIVVPDLEDREVIQRLTARAAVDARLKVVPFAHHGKRSALGVGIRRANGEILILADSDTRWEPGLLAAVLAPFADPKVGGVGTRQNAYLPLTSAWRRVADWMIDVRYLDYVRAQARAGAVACLSGRTAAYRRNVVLPVLEHLEDEFFLGRRCVSGDDGRLTWLVLASGYKTVYQSNARALSMFPDKGRAFLKQRLRWSRNSYRTYRHLEGLAVAAALHLPAECPADPRQPVQRHRHGRIGRHRVDQRQGQRLDRRGQHRGRQRQERLSGPPGLSRLGDRQRLHREPGTGERARVRHLRTEQETSDGGCLQQRRQRSRKRLLHHRMFACLRSTPTSQG
jgi:GT2 family glycosyltransferase